MHLGEKERTLLLALGDAVSVESREPFAILEKLASSLGYRADRRSGNLSKRPDTQDKKKRRVEAAEGAAGADVAADGKKEEEKDLEAGGRRLIPAELLTDDGSAYLEAFKVVNMKDSRKADQVQSVEQVTAAGDGAGLFQWLIAPCTQEQFFSTVFETKPLLVRRRKNSTYYAGLFGKADVQRLLKGGKLRYGFNIDVTLYDEKNLRQNFDSNGDGPANVQAGEEDALEVADPAVVWKRYKEGCSLRVLHPQRYCDPVWKLLAVLEHLFQCPVGCNSYLTPAGSQGFAPHFDDVDVFVLQLEGRKRWQVYKPLPGSILPRASSRDFSPQEIGSPILEVVLEPGDTLYLPRGTIHQAQSLPDHHSLHLTVSANQRNTWLDFLMPAVESGFQDLEASCLACRLSPPRDYFTYMGLMYQDYSAGAAKGGAAKPAAGTGAPRWATGAGDADDANRKRFSATARTLLRQLVDDLPLDAVADQLCARLVQQRLPPFGLPTPPQPPLEELPTGVVLRCAVANVARMIDEGDEETLTVMHCMNNNRLAHAALDEDGAEGETGEDADVLGMPYFEVPQEMADVVEVYLRDGAGFDTARLREVAGDVELAEEVVLTMYNLGIVTDK